MKTIQNFKCKTTNGTCPRTPERTSKGHQKDTNNNDNNIYIYFINKYKAQNLIRFNEKMKFLRDIKKDEKYKELTAEDEERLINYVMGRGA